MEQNHAYKYFTGEESLQFSFIQIPRLLLKDSKYKTISSDAKLLYGLLLDRMKVSMKNKWIDDQNRVYIFYSIEEIIQDLNCGRNKAIKALQELDTEKGIGLVEKRRQGQGKGTILYVMNFFEEEQKFKKQTSESLKSKLLEVCKKDTNYNKENYTKEKYNKSNLIVSSSDGTTEQDTIGYDKKETIDTETINIETINTESINTEIINTATINAYMEIIKKNIDYDALIKRYPQKEELIEGIFQLILETVMIQSDSLIIASNQYPKELVKSKLLKLRYAHIEYVIGCFEKNTTKIKNIKKYLLAALFNAPSTIDGYYRAEVNHDFPQYAAGE